MHDTNYSATYNLKDKSDRQVMAALGELVKRDHELCAELLAHLAEVDERRLHLAEAAPSLFVYCVERLNLSEDAAYKRIAACRAARRFPLIFSLVAQGELHLSAINLLAPHLTDDNHRELCLAARRQSKRQVEELLAARFPSPDVKTTLRKLPVAKAGTLPVVATTQQTPQPALVGPAPEALANDSAKGAGKSAPCSPPPVALRPLLAPLAPERYRLQLTVSGATRDKLLRARELLLHAQPDGDLGAVLDLALSTLIDTLERRKFGKTKRQTTSSRATESSTTKDNPLVALEELAPAPAAIEVSRPTAPRATAPSTHQHQTGEPEAAPKRSRHVPRAVRRLVAERDAYQCSFVAVDGTRCQSRGRLEFHHRTPYARGGVATVDGVELRCAAHNRHQAEIDFGKQAVRAAIEKQQRKRSPTNTLIAGPSRPDPRT